MDFTKAFACMALAFVLTDAVKRVVPAKLPAFVTQALAFAVGIATIFMVGASVWAHTQVIGGHTLDTLNAGSKIVAGLIIGGGATVLDRITLIASRDQGPKPE